jgi:hypothetical protein
MALVVGYGCDALLSLPVATIRRIFGGVILAQLVVVGCGFVVAGWFGLTIAPVDVVRVGLMITATIRVILADYHGDVVGWIGADDCGDCCATFSGATTEALIETTPLTQTLQQQVPLGARFAVVSAPLEYLLAPNYNAMLGVASVHSYNNFFTPYYQRLIQQLGGKMTVYGKLNRAIAPKLC